MALPARGLPEEKALLSKEKTLANSGSTVALLDVDDTLITGRLVIDNYEDAKALEAQLQEEGILNSDLINALKKAQVKDIYLFTDMSFRKTNIQERLALIAVLKELGFTVHGVITPADCAWHLPEEELRLFAESKEANLPRDIEHLRNQKQLTEAQAQLAKLHDQGNYKKLIAALQFKVVGEPGKAFAEAATCIEQPEELQKKANKANYVKCFTEAVCISPNDLLHTKYKMFQCFFEHNKKRFKRAIVCDDRMDVIESVKKAAAFPHSIETTVVYVNNNTKPKKQAGEQSKNFASYLNDFAPIILKNACEVYQVYLEKLIAAEMEKNKQDESKCKQNPNFVLATRKLAAIKEMVNTVGLTAFRNKFIEHRALLETRRDTCGKTFLKVLATIFSFGIAAACGLWKVKGRETTAQITELLPAEEKPSAKPN